MTLVIFLVVLMLCVVIGLPIAFSLMITGIALMLHLDFLDSQIMAQNLVKGANNFSLLAIPFFILAGEIMNVGGLSKRIIDLPMKIVGHYKGGLGFVAILAAMIMASMSGSAVADTAAVGAMLFPMMKDAGYHHERSAGLIASGGIIAPIIPPSIPFIVFGVASGVSISKLFLAGIAPGIMIGIMLCFVWYFISQKMETAVLPKASFKEIVISFKRSFWALLLPCIIVFGFRFGVFTPTEAGVVAAFYALFISAFIYKEMSFKLLYDVLLASCKTSAVVLLLVAAAQISAWLMVIAELPNLVTHLLEPFIGHQLMLMAIIMGITFIVGMVMDLTPAVLILCPVLMPVVYEAGIDPVYFGVMFIINLSIGLITPPVGNVLNVIAGLTKLSFDRAVIGLLPYIAALILMLMLFMFIPQLITVPMAFIIGQ